jgi:hypothetical protein
MFRAKQIKTSDDKGRIRTGGSMNIRRSPANWRFAPWFCGLEWSFYGFDTSFYRFGPPF